MKDNNFLIALIIVLIILIILREYKFSIVSFINCFTNSKKADGFDASKHKSIIKKKVPQLVKNNQHVANNTDIDTDETNGAWSNALREQFELENPETTNSHKEFAKEMMDTRANTQGLVQTMGHEEFLNKPIGISQEQLRRWATGESQKARVLPATIGGPASVPSEFPDQIRI